MLKFKINERSYQVAASFNELNRRQLYAYVERVYHNIPNLFEVVDGKTKIKSEKMLQETYHFLFVILLNFDIKLVDQLTRHYPVLEDGQPVLDEDGELLTYNNAHFLIYEQGICNFFFKEYLTTNPVQFLKSGKKLFGPADNFKNIRIEEYFYADKLYLAFHKSGDDDFLHKLVATLYRPKKAFLNTNAPDFDGDVREPFNEHLLMNRVEEIKKHPRELLFLIYLWYEGCRRQLIRDYEFLFDRNSSTGSIELKPEEELVTLCGGWEKYPNTKHYKLRLLFSDLHASAKRSIMSKAS